MARPSSDTLLRRVRERGPGRIKISRVGQPALRVETSARATTFTETTNPDFTNPEITDIGSPTTTVTTLEWSSLSIDNDVVVEGPAPTALQIEAIGVTAPVIPLGVVADTGQMEVPDNVDEVGWYRFGPSPGQPGSSVLAAHVDLYREGPGVFYNLDRLMPATASTSFSRLEIRPLSLSHLRSECLKGGCSRTRFSLRMASRPDAYYLWRCLTTPVAQMTTTSSSPPSWSRREERHGRAARSGPVGCGLALHRRIEIAPVPSSVPVATTTTPVPTTTAPATTGSVDNRHLTSRPRLQSRFLFQRPPNLRVRPKRAAQVGHMDLADSGGRSLDCVSGLQSVSRSPHPWGCGFRFEIAGNARRGVHPSRRTSRWYQGFQAIEYRAGGALRGPRCDPIACEVQRVEPAIDAAASAGQIEPDHLPADACGCVGFDTSEPLGSPNTPLRGRVSI